MCLKCANDGYNNMGPCELMVYTLMNRCAWANEGLIIMGVHVDLYCSYKGRYSSLGKSWAYYNILGPKLVYCVLNGHDIHGQMIG